MLKIPLSHGQFVSDFLYAIQPVITDHIPSKKLLLQFSAGHVIFTPKCPGLLG